MLRLLLALVGLPLVIATPCFAQETKTVPRTVITMEEPPASFKRIGQAEVNYFAGTDTTEVRTEWPAYKGETLGAGMWFVFRVKGKSVTRPEVVEVNLSCSASKEVLQKVDTFKLFVDNEELRLGRMTVEGVRYELNAQEFRKSIHTSIPFDAFEKLVKSQSVKVRVGEVAFVLNQKSRDALRDMLKAVEK